MVAGGSEQFGVTGAPNIIARSKGFLWWRRRDYRESRSFCLRSKNPAYKGAEFGGRNIVSRSRSEELIYRAILKSANVDKARL